ncbi:helicase HerA-like domain-containing protein [Azospirillum halopraeferens]|uniref:helicase HerA-like domain-containing protein n=1 Tax=Azospirillum halopraeferens TaxID=34010 RepID=UPI0003FABF49|nr:helicase HerA-like domain-containing protein [Azospirillum halopraeferens]
MTTDSAGLVIGGADGPVRLLARYANRHGLIAGATGTGKTLTLQVLAEGFADLGTAVFVVDAKGDLAGIARPGTPRPAFADRLDRLGLPADDWRGNPALLWDVFGRQGHPVRVPVSEIGPLLLARLLDLNPIQTGVLTVAFAVADDEGLLLLDLKDLRAMLGYVGENAKALAARYGSVSAASVGAIGRALLALEQEGGDALLGEPGLDPGDLMRTDAQGRGVVSVLAADVLLERPRLYGTVLVWLLSELFETLPEVGDLDRPRLVLFFDEAHLLFDGTPRELTDRIERVVRLIRSKGVGVYFVTQSPLDIPESVLGQLGNRVQHALRAFTPRDRKAVRAAADTFRPNPRFDTTAVIGELGVGEALVSFLDERGAPAMVERTLIRPPRSRVGPLTADERAATVAASPVAGVYDTAIDRESAYERLRAREGASPPPSPAPAQRAAGRSRVPATASRGSTAERIATGIAREIGTQLGRRIVRGILGSILKG